MNWGDWRAKAACKGRDTREFFPKADWEQEIVALGCRECPVQQECLDFALSAREQYGVWGGKTETQRRKMKARSRKAS